MWIECNIFESYESNCLLSKWFILEAVLPPEECKRVDGGMDEHASSVTCSNSNTDLIGQIQGPKLTLQWSWGLAVLVGMWED